MPAVNIQGQNSIIEQPMASNITDNSVSNPNRDRQLSTAASMSSYKHLKEMAARYDAARRSNTDALAELRQTEVNAQAHRDRTVAEYVKTRHKLTPEATAEDDAIIAEATEEYAARSKKKFPVLDFDEVKRLAPKYRNWLPHNKKYFVGDSRHPDDQRKAAKKDRIAAEAKLDIAIQSPRHSEDAKASGMVSLRSHADKGKPITSGLLQGYTVDYKGEFQLNLHPSIAFPEDWSKPTQFSDDLALVDSALDIMIWANFDAFAAAVTKQIVAEADDANAIRDADRPAMIAVAKAELLAAQRAEEYANKLCERTGIPVFRPSSDWPIQVLLEVEAPSKIKNVSLAPVVNAAPVEGTDAPEFEDDSGEE